MSFIEHIPGTKPIEHRDKHPQAKRLGVIGLHEGRTLLLAMNRCSKVVPVAGCDENEEKIHASADELPDLFYTTNYDEMLARPDIDIIAIYTPDSLHADHIIRAFNAGKDVICTKPLVNSLDDASRLLEAGRRTQRRLMVGQSTRFFEPFMRQRRDIVHGAFGGLNNIELVDAHYIHRMDWFYRKSPWATTDTDWVFLGLSHPIDLVRWYLGRIVEVHAYAQRSALGKLHKLTGNDIYIVNLRSESGRIGRAMGHYGCHELPTARNCIELMLYGSGGTSLAQYHDMKYIHTGDPATGDDMTEITEDHLYAGRHYYFNSEVHGMHYGEFANYAESFAACLIENKPNSPDLEEGVETVCVMEAVRRSAQSGQPVDVQPMLHEIGFV